jgi:dolichol-phosphate mannosyltransferase
MVTADSDVDYSIVIPVYFNEGSLRQTMQMIGEEVLTRNPERRGEVIFVDDGSGDGSLEVLIDLHQRRPEVVRVIKLARNFGQLNAIMAGFAQARGKCVVVMAADGQDPPSLVNEMLSAHFDERYEVVICTRQGRDESLGRTLASRLFYWLIRKLSFPNMPLGGFDFLLLGRRARDAVLRNCEAHAFLQGQILWTGFKPKFLHYHRRVRISGRSRWSFGRKITYLIDGVVAYSFLPIRLMSFVGILVALAGFAYALLILVMKLSGGISTYGWAPLMIVILVVGGVQMLLLGIIGEYVWRALAQSRNREPYIIEAIYESPTRE